MRLDHKTLVAMTRVTTRLILADQRIELSELKKLSEIENQFGIHHALMPEASGITLSEAIAQLATLPNDVLTAFLDALLDLAGSDRMCEQREALLLLALRSSLLPQSSLKGQVLSFEKHLPDSASLVGRILYFEPEVHPEHHRQLEQHWEMLQMLLQPQGFRLFYTEKMVDALVHSDSELTRNLLSYMAPRHNDEQLAALFNRMEQTDTASFCQHALIQGLGLNALRQHEPALLLGIGRHDLLCLPLQSDVLTTINQLLQTYMELVTPSALGQSTIAGPTAGQFRYDGFQHLFFQLLVEAEPKESRMVIWPNKSEFSFPEAGLTLKLNQQEASMLTLILLQTFRSKGLPLAYTKDQRAIEALYRSIYGRKKYIETEEILYPDNLAPIRAKIEKKMRTQLAELSNLEEFIPMNYGREGYYRVLASPDKVTLHSDLDGQEMALTDFVW